MNTISKQARTVYRGAYRPITSHLREAQRLKDDFLSAGLYSTSCV